MADDNSPEAVAERHRIKRMKREQRRLAPASNDGAEKKPTADDDEQQPHKTTTASSERPKAAEEADDVKHKNTKKKLPAEEGKPGPATTLSVAIPASVLNVESSPELKTVLISRVARALTLHGIDEVVVYDDGLSAGITGGKDKLAEALARQRAVLSLARQLQYAECPPYLRTFFFPDQHIDLRHVEAMLPIDLASHTLPEDGKADRVFYEGVVVDIDGTGSYVDIGLKHYALLDKKLKSGVRVTVRLSNPKADLATDEGRYKHTYVTTCYRSIMGVVLTSVQIAMMPSLFRPQCRSPRPVSMLHWVVRYLTQILTILITAQGSTGGTQCAPHRR